MRVKEKLWEIVGGAGLVLLLIGVAGMDSEMWLIPAVLMIAGLAMCYTSAMALEKKGN